MGQFFYRMWQIGVMLLATVAACEAADNFPLRTDYKDVVVISQQQLARQLTDYTIVDVRSALEYEILHIQGALNVEFDNWQFHHKIKSLYAQQRKPLVFYSGSSNCRDAYQAVLMMHNIVPDAALFTYDGGIGEWTDTNLRRTVYRGQFPANARDLIKTDQYREHLLPPMKFENKIASRYVVLDIRTHQEREGVGLFFGHEQWVGINKYDKLTKFLKKVKASGKPLLVFDNNGDKTRLLQYELQRLGIKEYFFMAGGATAYYAMIAGMHDRGFDHGQVSRRMDALAGRELAADSKHMVEAPATAMSLKTPVGADTAMTTDRVIAPDAGAMREMTPPSGALEASAPLDVTSIPMNMGTSNPVNDTTSPSAQLASHGAPR